MNIVNLNDLEKVMISKNEVESKLIEEKQIKEKMKLDEFVKYLSMEKYIFIKQDSVVPFRIIYDYLFITGNNNVDAALDALKKINYDLSVLTKVEINDVYAGKLEGKEYFFIIDSNYYIL